MDARLGTQPAVSVLSGNMHRRTLDTGDFTRRGLDDLCLEPMRLRPAQIHTQNHLRPVLGFCAAGTRLDVEIRVVGIHLTGEHTAKLKVTDTPLVDFEIANDLVDRIGIIFVERQVEELAGIAKTGRQFVETDNDLFERGALLAKRLGAIGFVPDVGLFELALDFGQAFGLALVVKDTSSTPGCVQRGR